MADTCVECSRDFELRTYGQDTCTQCVEVEAMKEELDDGHRALWVDTSSTIELCRDLAQDAVDILDNAKTFTKEKRAALRAVIEKLRITAADNIPDEPGL